MAQEIPSWMNAEFTQRVLRRSEQDDTIEVVDVYSKMGTNKGDNYCSDIYRLFVELRRVKDDKTITEKKSIILKFAPTAEGNRRDLIENSGIFLVEIDMMTNTLKKMNEIVGKNFRFNATAYHVERSYPGFLILEDLTPLGYRMAQRQFGLDLDHCLLVMRNLAKFHASSAVLCQREPSHKKLYTKGLFNMHSSNESQAYFGTAIKVLAEEVEHWPELEPKYAEKIKKLSETAYSRASAIMKPRDEEFNVINHGDCWVNNMLFQYNEQGKPVGHIFVDFQMSVYTTPAIDLHYYLSTSPTLKVFDESKELLLEEYLRTLTSCLKEFGYKGTIPTMDVLQRYLKEREYYAVMCTFVVAPFILAEVENVISIDEIVQKDGTYNNPTYKGAAFRKLMLKKIPYFEQRGLLDS